MHYVFITINILCSICLLLLFVSDYYFLLFSLFSFSPSFWTLFQSQSSLNLKLLLKSCLQSFGGNVIPLSALVASPISPLTHTPSLLLPPETYMCILINWTNQLPISTTKHTHPTCYIIQVRILLQNNPHCF